MLTWTKNPRRGFVPAHWTAQSESGRNFMIDQIVTKWGRRGSRTVKTRLIVIGGSQIWVENVAAAKKAAEIYVQTYG